MTRPVPHRVAAAAVFAVLAVLMLTGALSASFNHDENQFLVPPFLWREKGLLPYVDYAYFHTPLLVWLHAGLFSLTDHPLLAARIAGAALGFAVLMLIWRLARDEMREGWGDGAGPRMAALACVALVGFNRSTSVAVSHVWNHAASVAFAAVAFVLVLAGARRPSAAAIGAAGVCLGLAAATRLTLAPLVLPFLAALPFLDRRPGERPVWRRTAWLAAGLALGLAPVAWLAARAPEAFWFGNFRYPAISAAWLAGEGIAGTSPAAAAARTLKYTAVVLPMLVALLALCWRAGGNPSRVAFALAALAFAAAGAYSPYRIHRQYHYAVVVFAALAGAVCLGHLSRRVPRPVWLARAGAVVCAAALLDGAWKYPGPDLLLRPGDWTPNRVGALAREVAARAGRGRVLTLASAIPWLGGATTPAAFATGPFAWRVADRVDPAARAAFGVVGAAELPALLSRDPPDAILTGVEDAGLEAALVRAARGQELRAVALPGTRARPSPVLWLPAGPAP